MRRLWWCCSLHVWTLGGANRKLGRWSSWRSFAAERGIFAFGGGGKIFFCTRVLGLLAPGVTLVLARGSERHSALLLMMTIERLSRLCEVEGVVCSLLTNVFCNAFCYFFSGCCVCCGHSSDCRSCASGCHVSSVFGSPLTSTFPQLTKKKWSGNGPKSDPHNQHQTNLRPQKSWTIHRPFIVGHNLVWYTYSVHSSITHRLVEPPVGCQHPTKRKLSRQKTKT